jgi:hypothetical protein
MANATRKPVQDYTYTLELSEAEARTIYVMCGKVSGDYENSPGKHSNAVFSALARVLGVSAYETEEQSLLVVLTGGIKFGKYNGLGGK